LRNVARVLTARPARACGCTGPPAGSPPVYLE